MNPSSAAEKISDLFHVTLSELETNIVSQTIKFSNQPQRLVEELQSAVSDFKSRFYESLHHLLQFIAQLCGSSGKDVLKIAQQVEVQVTKFKQQQLLVQMKLVVNQKLKALMETFYTENQQKFEIQSQMNQLKESLQKIESTLLEQQHSTPQYITPYPKKNFFTASSNDMLTPNLSEEAEQRGKGFFITPEQRQQQPRQFEHSQQQSLNESVNQNKTLNSFNKEKSEEPHNFDEVHNSAHFGQQQQQNQQQKLFQNEIMDEYFSRIPLYQSQSQQQQLVLTQQYEQQLQQSQQPNNNIEGITTTRTETMENLIDMEQDQNELITPSLLRNSSAQSVKKPTPKQMSPKRLIQTSKSKESISRSRSSLETTNLMVKLNQAENVQSTKNQNSKIHIKAGSNKENSQRTNMAPKQTTKPIVTISKPKQLVIKKEQNLIKKNVK